MTLLRPVIRIALQRFSMNSVRCCCRWRDATPRHCHSCNERRACLRKHLPLDRKSAARRRELARMLGYLAEVDRSSNHPDRAMANLIRAIGILDDSDRRESPEG